MPWFSKKRIAYAAGKSSARPGEVDQSAEVSGKEVSSKALQVPVPSR